MMELKQLESFVAVIKYGSFTSGTCTLYVTTVYQHAYPRFRAAA